MTTQKKFKPGLLFEIALVIGLKLCFIFCLWYLFFSPSHRTAVTPDRMGDVFFSGAQERTAAPVSETASVFSRRP